MTQNQNVYQNKEQELYDNETDLGQLIRIIWINKYIILFFFIISIPISVMYANSITPNFVGEVVIEKPVEDSKGDKEPAFQAGGAIFSLLDPGNAASGSFSHISLIRSNSFLKTVIIDNNAIDPRRLTKICPTYGPPAPYSLGSLLVMLGVSEIRTPNEEQKLEYLIECLKDKFSVGTDKHGDIETTAVKIKVNSPDPIFSANFANELAKK